MMLIFYNIDLHLHVLTVATEETDGYKRFIDSANHYDIKVEVYWIMHRSLYIALYTELYKLFVIFIVGYWYGQRMERW